MIAPLAAAPPLVPDDHPAAPFLAALRRWYDLRGLAPSVQQFLRDYLRHERVRQVGDRWVINSHFPPAPSRAFGRLIAEGLGPDRHDRLYSATLALTNRCMFRCAHCYNAYRSPRDLPTAAWVRIIRQVQDLGALRVTLSGGEALLRDDLPALAAAFDDRSAVTLQTTGWGWNDDLARALADTPVWAISCSLDAPDAATHDALRRRPGAHAAALDAIAGARRHGLYVVAVTVATRSFIEQERVHDLCAFAGEVGVHEVHLLEPAPAGRWVDSDEVTLDAPLRTRLLEWQREYATHRDGPALSSFAYVEGAEAFGCGAGTHQIYVDGTGEVSPCNLVGLSVGNAMEEPLPALTARLRTLVGGACTGCMAHTTRPRLAERFREAARAGDDAVRFPVRVTAGADDLRPSPDGPVPAFYRALARARVEVAAPDVGASYDRVAGDYETAWLQEAAAPVRELLGELPVRGARVLDVGCGTGFAAVGLARRGAADVTGVDLSPGMLAGARERARRTGCADRITWVGGDFLALAGGWPAARFDVIVSSWVLGYLPLAPAFAAMRRLLAPGGRVGLVVHRDRSPFRELELFESLVAREPDVMARRVQLDFPADADDLVARLRAGGLAPRSLAHGRVRFACADGRAALDHLLRSGAGTVYHDAVRPEHRTRLEQDFVQALDAARAGRPCDVVHDYFRVTASAAPPTPD